MSILKIARVGHPLLLRSAEPVADPGAPAIRQLVADMIETMEDASAVGLAAPQVHVPLRLFVFRVPAARATDGVPVANSVLINPMVEPVDEERVLGWEGCLSIPGMRAGVPRWARVRYAGLDCDGNPVDGEAAGFHAAVIQHENDHLNGILYPARVTDWTLFGFNEELARAGG